MKILIATDCYIFNMGGVTASILALCKGLRHRGHEVKTLSLSNRNESFREGDDYFIRSFPAFYYQEMRTSFAIHDPLIKELEEWGPDIIHAQTEGSARRFAIHIMHFCKAPLVMTCHTDYGYFVFGKLRGLPPVKFFMTTLGSILYKDAIKLTVPSQKAAGFPFVQGAHNRLTVVPNGMEIEKYQKKLSAEERKSLRASLGIGENTGTLVCISRLSKEKNIRELIEYFPDVLKKMPDARFVIVGDGPDKQHLEKMVEKLELQDKIIFTGRIPADEVWRYYALGDVFVSASTFEVHSMSYLEALAGGLPMLCREDTALLGVLDPGKNGYMYRSLQEFVDYAVKLLSDDAFRKTMADCSLKKSEEFSCDAFADSMLRVYEEAITYDRHDTAKPDQEMPENGNE